MRGTWITWGSFDPEHLAQSEQWVCAQWRKSLWANSRIDRQQSMQQTARSLGWTSTLNSPSPVFLHFWGPENPTTRNLDVFSR